MTTVRTAVILVAGTGSRLWPLTREVPKALLSLGTESILLRMVRQLEYCGIQRIVLATGYREDMLHAALMSTRSTIEFCHNSDYAKTQNSVSLGCCELALGQQPFIKLDGDLVFETRVLQRVLDDASPMVVAMDSSKALDAEAMKIVTSSSHIVCDFGKHISHELACGESLGIEKLDAHTAREVLVRIRDLVAQGITDRYYEDVYAELIRQGHIIAKTVDVAGLVWTEVDSIEDLQQARLLVAQGIG
jgi:choline kinase